MYILQNATGIYSLKKKKHFEGKCQNQEGSSIELSFLKNNFLIFVQKIKQSLMGKNSTSSRSSPIPVLIICLIKYDFILCRE